VACASVEHPVAAMEDEHTFAIEALDRLRWLTKDYQIPGNASDEYRAIVVRLANLDNDLRLHIHEENNVLFPRAISLEGARRRGKQVQRFK
jgi:regulator of cell morphogenesis and NO signaling